MRVHQGATKTRRAAPARETRVPGRGRLLARGTWITLVVLCLVMLFASLPEQLARLHTLCTPTACAPPQLVPAQAAVLRRLGWSLEGYAAVLVVLSLAIVGFSVLLSTLIIWRRPDDRMALLVALMIVPPAVVIATNAVASGSPSPWQVPDQGLRVCGLALILLVFSLFPSGRFVPRFTRWSLGVGIAGLVLFTFFPTTLPLSRLGFLLFLSETALLVGAQVYRYRRVSGPLERQQTKGVLFAFTLSAAVYVGGQVLALLSPTLADRTSPAGAPYQLLLNNIVLLTAAVPLAFGVAVLRYRLWDIDTVINKALVYGGLSGVLGALYVGLVVGLSALLRTVLGPIDNFGVVTTIATLAIAALFLAVRKRIQALVDRRFYRRKYDAEKTLAAFSATLRQETDLEQISQQLIAVVQETMQPTHVSLWLRPLADQRTALPHRLEPPGPGPIQPSDG